MADEQWPQPRERKTLWYYLKRITVEPTIILYMMAVMTTIIAEQAFFVDKACRVNYGLNTTDCNFIAFANDNRVQITVFNFKLWNYIVGRGGPMIMALYMGAWSDKRGRKLPLLIGLFGKLYYLAMVLINASQDTWPLEYVMYTATLPMAFTGADAVIIISAFTYLVDISSQKSRRMRITILEGCYQATMHAGMVLEFVLYNKITHKWYMVMFAVSITLLVFSVIYTFLRLDWRTDPCQKPISEAPDPFSDFFDYNHVIDTAKTLFKKRRHNRRVYLLLLIVMMAFYTFQQEGKERGYLYVISKFNLSFNQFHYFLGVRSAIQDVFLLVAIPLMSRVFGWKDTVIIMIGALVHSVGQLLYANTNVWQVFYLGGVFEAMGPMVAPVIKSMVSKLVANSESGKMFAVLAVADIAIPPVSGMLYIKICRSNAVFYLTMATQVSIFLLILCIHLRAKDEYLNHKDEGEEGRRLRVEYYVNDRG